MSSTVRFRPLVLASALATAGTLLPPALSQGPAEGAGSTQDAVRAGEASAPALGADLVVNGYRVPEMVLKRELVYLLGNTLLESRKLDLFIDEEVQRQIEAGTPAEDFEITSDEIQAAADQAIGMIEEQYPGEDVEDVLQRGNLSQDTLAVQVRQTKRFDRVFLPPNPKDWPETTVALMAGSGGQQLVDKLIESYEAREAQGEEIDPDDPSMAMWKTILRKLVIQGLNKSAVVKTGADGLPPELAMSVNGLEVTTDEMYKRVVARVHDEQLRRVRLWVAKTVALEQELERRGQLLTGDALAAAYDEHISPYKESPFPIEVLAMGFKKFPSMDAYKRYFQLMQSYENALKANGEMSDAYLSDHLPRANQMLGLAQVNSEMILCAAFDFSRNSWHEDGWQRAADRATEVSKKLAEGADWYEVLEEYSEFYDAPVPQSTQFQQPPQKKNKGRFGPLNRNELVQRMGESEYDMFLLGSSVADHVFFCLLYTSPSPRD